MKRPHYVLIASHLLTAVLAFAIGRETAPKVEAKTVEIRTIERDTTLTFSAYVGKTTVTEKRVQYWKTITRWEPTGAVVETKEASNKEAKETNTSIVAQESSVKTAEKQHESKEETKKERDNWYLSARYGLDKSYNSTFSLSVSRRILGPIYIEAWATRPLEAGLGLGFSF